MIDAYVLRSLIRRCNYDADVVSQALRLIGTELGARNQSGNHTPDSDEHSEATHLYAERYAATNMADAVIFPHLNATTVMALTTKHLNALHQIAISMLAHKPFPIVSVHDEFRCHANNMNHLRQHYVDIFAEMADSTILGDILGQLHGVDGSYDKLSTNLSDAIRMSNYSLS